MARAVQLFDHDTPAAPTRAAGMLLGASGVTHPPLQVLGTLSGTSAADGSFNDTNGFGQIDYAAGYMYVADYTNNRIQRFAKNASGVWAYESKLTGIGTIFGGGNAVSVVAIDRTANEIHIALSNNYVASDWVWVWSLANWPSLTSGNVVRKYGANANSSIAGRVREGIGLSIDGTYALAVSGSGSSRTIIWNHLTGALVADIVSSGALSQPCNDGAGNWWWGSDLNLGVQKINPATLGVLSTLTGTTANAWRPNRLFSSTGGPVAYHDGRVYFRDNSARIIAYDAATGAYLDTFADPGSFEGSTFVGKVGSNQSTASSYRNKFNIVVDADGCAWLAKWDNGANNATTNCVVTMQPIGDATATWTKTDWSAGVNTLTSIFPWGLHLSGEKYKIRLRKNAGSWITFTTEDARNEAFFSSLGTFTEGDTLTVELSLSTWDRLDFASSLVATRDKLSPSNISIELNYEDSVADVYVPYASGALRGKLGGTGAFRGRLGG